MLHGERGGGKLEFCRWDPAAAADPKGMKTREEDEGKWVLKDEPIPYGRFWRATSQCSEPEHPIGQSQAIAHQ